MEPTHELLFQPTFQKGIDARQPFRAIPVAVGDSNLLDLVQRGRVASDFLKMSIEDPPKPQAFKNIIEFRINDTIWASCGPDFTSPADQIQ